MVKKILKTLTNNFGYKLLAFMLACLLWLVVYNLDDPNKTKTFTTNVTITNADVVSDMNKSYQVMKGSNTVSFSITTKRSYMEKLEDTDFTAVADMKNMVISEDQQSATVPIVITSSVYNRYITYNDKTQYINVSLDERMSKQFVVSAKTSGEVAEGYALGEVRVNNPTVIKVSGPESVVSRIDHVSATIDVSNMTVDLSDNVVPVLYNKNNKEIDPTRLTLSNSIVTVSARILSTKKVPINISTVGTPAWGYTLMEASANPKEVTLKGTMSTLNPITSIDIPGEILNVGGLKEDIVTTIDVMEYLPEGVELVDDSQRTIEVIVPIEGYETREFDVPTSNFVVQGIATNLKAKYVDENVSVQVSGMESDLDALTVNDIRGVLDATGLGKGTHRIRAEIQENEKYSIKAVRVDVILVDVSTNSNEQQ